MIDPITAMAAVSSAVSMIKKASAMVDDVKSLGPLLGKYFDAKQTAVKAVRENKKAGGSNMAKAIELGVPQARIERAAARSLPSTTTEEWGRVGSTGRFLLIKGGAADQAVPGRASPRFLPPAPDLCG